MHEFCRHLHTHKLTALEIHYNLQLLQFTVIIIIYSFTTEHSRELFAAIQAAPVLLPAFLSSAAAARWLRHRQIYAPAFKQNAIDVYLQVVQRAGKRFVEKLA